VAIAVDTTAAASAQTTPARFVALMQGKSASPRIRRDPSIE
jgi:hypothetical protein